MTFSLFYLSLKQRNLSFKCFGTRRLGFHCFLFVSAAIMTPMHLISVQSEPRHLGSYNNLSRKQPADFFGFADAGDAQA